LAPSSAAEDTKDSSNASLAARFPGVGASIGVDRLLAAMQKLGLVEGSAATAQVLVTVMDRSGSPSTNG